MSCVSASAVDSEAAEVPETEVCARVGERAREGHWAWGCGSLAGASEET